MATKADFTAEEWDQVREGAASAGIMIIAAHRGGTIRESFSMAKVYAEAHTAGGENPLIAAIAGDKPELDKERAQSGAELREHLLTNVREGVAAVQAKAPDDVEAYKGFLLKLADRVANARKEGFLGLHGERVGPEEREAIEALAGELGLPAPEPAEG